MIYPYSFSYNYLYYYDKLTTLIVILLVAVILAVVLFLTFMSKKNEGKFTGKKEKIYNFLCFNKFYAENILKLLYVVTAVVVTVLGIAFIFLNNIIGGLLLALAGNVLIRVSYELLMMFIILCRKTVSLDKRLDKIEKIHEEDFCADEAEAGEKTAAKDSCENAEQALENAACGNEKVKSEERAYEDEDDGEDIKPEPPGDSVKTESVQDTKPLAENENEDADSLKMNINISDR